MGFRVFAASVLAFSPASQAQRSLWDAFSRDSLVERFFAKPKTLDVSLSPDGKYLARVVLVESSHTRFEHVDVPRVEIIDLDKNQSWLLPLTKRGYAMGDPAGLSMWVAMPRRVTWISADLIAVDYTDEVGVVFAIKGAGAQARLKFTRYAGTIRADGEDTMSVVYTTGKDSHFQRARIDDWKEQRFVLNLPGQKVLDWRLDATGLVRMVRTVEDEESASPRRVTWYRKAETTAWQKIDERGALDEAFNPVGVTSAPNRITVQAHNGGDRLAVWSYDVDSHAFLDAVVSQSDADVVPRARDLPSDGLAAVVADGLLPHTMWLDERMSRLQAAADAALPNRLNELQAGHSSRILVRSRSDVDPGHLYVLDPATFNARPTAAASAIRP